MRTSSICKYLLHYTNIHRCLSIYYLFRFFVVFDHSIWFIQFTSKRQGDSDNMWHTHAHTDMITVHEIRIVHTQTQARASHSNSLHTSFSLPLLLVHFSVYIWFCCECAWSPVSSSSLFLYSFHFAVFVSHIGYCFRLRCRRRCTTNRRTKVVWYLPPSQVTINK